MNIKEKIKSLLGEEKFSAIESLLKAAFSEVVAKDGSVIKYDGDLKAGTAVFVSTPDGDIAVPDGVVELEDGTMVEVAAGVVVSVTPAAGEAKEEAPAEGEMTTQEMATALNDVFAKLEALTTKVSELETKFTAEPKDDINAKIETAINDLKASEIKKMKEDFSVMLTLVNEIGDLPVGEVKEKEAQNFTTATDKRTKRILELSKTLNK